jgi:hypothetical protein
MNMISTATTFITRVVAKRAGTYMQPGHDGLHINRISLRAAPWDEPEVEAVHPIPAPVNSIFNMISISTPPVARPRVAIVDRFAQNGQDVLREGWMEGIPEKMRKGYRPKRAASEATERPSAKSLRAVMDHLAQGSDTRAGIMFSTQLSEQTMARVSAELRNTGMVVLTKCMGVSTYTLAPSGHVALAERVAADAAPQTAGNRANEVYDFLLLGSATRREIKTALGISDWMLDEALTVLYDRGLKRERVGNFAFFSVTA